MKTSVIEACYQVSKSFMTEADFQTKFNLWLKYRHYRTSAFELKITKDPSIAFNRVEKHQRDALYFAKHGNFVYKIPDDTIAQKPFDCLMLVGIPAFVAIMFWSPKVRHFYLIDIDAWIEEEDRSERKSLTEGRAKEIGQLCEFESVTR